MQLTLGLLGLSAKVQSVAPTPELFAVYSAVRYESALWGMTRDHSVPGFQSKSRCMNTVDFIVKRIRLCLHY